jgi:hypothetical protein
MQQLSLNYSIIWQEISLIQQQILSAASQCQPNGGRMSTVVAGNTPMTFVTGVNTITVNNAGSGYVVDRPTLMFIPPNGSAALGAAGTVTTDGSKILSATITAGGTGYQPRPSSMSVSSLTGTGAILVPLVNTSGQIVGVNIVNGGSGYTLNDTVFATRAMPADPAYINAVFKITSISVTGQIMIVEILNPGTGYEDSLTQVRIISSLNTSTTYPVGTGFYGMVLTNPAGSITGVSILNGGAGYANLPPTLRITDPGTGAQTQVNLNTTGGVNSIAVLRPGNNYTQSATGQVINPSTAPNPTVAAQVTINVSNNTYGTNPNAYWNVWAGVDFDSQIEAQINAVLSYFKSKGYTIEIQSNPATGSTIQWNIFW